MYVDNDSFAIPLNQLSSESSSDTSSSSSEDSDVESDSDHDAVISHYSNSDLLEGDASDSEENNHINIQVRETRLGRNVPFFDMVTAFCTADSFE